MKDSLPTSKKVALLNHNSCSSSDAPKLRKHLWKLPGMRGKDCCGCNVQKEKQDPKQYARYVRSLQWPGPNCTLCLHHQLEGRRKTNAHAA
jgi:hypothetical protein